MRLRLPDVTLAVVETRLHRLAAMAVADCVEAVEFGDVVVVTDDFSEFAALPARHRQAADPPDKAALQRLVYAELCSPLIKTSHVLFVEWDAWVVNPRAWTDELLEYDYTGAPWWYTDGLNVGNGGFSLRSTRLMDHLRDTGFEPGPSADDRLCRSCRPGLEEVGFRWAPEHLAHAFAFELRLLGPPHGCFGFHGAFNWPLVLGRDRLAERVRVAREFPYITGNRNMWVPELEAA